MRIERIDFARVGAWTGRCLSFAPGLNIVTGANEAGKSTALRAIEALLFPVATGGAHGLTELARPLSAGSFDATLHAARDQGAGTEIIGWRRWGARIEDLQGQPLDPAIMRAWLWEISQQDYRLVYALGHDRLREGGKLLEKDGAVSTIIADLTGGVRGLPELRATLADQRDAQYLMGGNAKRVLNISLAGLREQADRRRQQEQAQEHGLYLTHMSDIDDGRAAEAQKNEALNGYDREIRALVELKFAPPILADVAALTEQKIQLATASTMPPRSWFEDACSLETALKEATAAVGAAVKTHNITLRELEGRQPSAPVLAASDKISAALAWDKDFESYEANRQAAGGRRDEQLGKLISILQEIGVHASRDDVVDASATFRIDRARKKNLVEALETAKSARDKAGQAAATLANEKERLADHERKRDSLPRSASLAPLLDAQALGQVHAAESTAEELRQATEVEVARLRGVAARLGFPPPHTLDAWVSTAVPAGIQTQVLETEHLDLNTRREILQEKLGSDHAAEDQARQRLAEAERLLDPALNRQTLAGLRAERDTLEQRLVTSAVGGPLPVETLYDFGKAVHAIDALVDRLLDHAKLVADRDAANRALEAATTTVAGTAERLEACNRDRDDLEERWRTLWAASGVTVSIGNAQWRGDHARFLSDAEALRGEQGKAHTAAQAAASRRQAVEQVLDLVGQQLTGPALDRRLAEAMGVQQEAHDRRMTAEQSVTDALKRLEGAQRSLAEMETHKKEAEGKLIQLAANAPALIAGDNDRVEAWIRGLDALDLAANALRGAIEEDERIRKRHDEALEAVGAAFAALAARGVDTGTVADTSARLRLATLSQLIDDARITQERENAAAMAKEELDARRHDWTEALERLATHLVAATGESIAPNAQAIHEIMQRLEKYYDLDAQIADKKTSACRDRDFGWEELVARVGTRDVAALDGDIRLIETKKGEVQEQLKILRKRITDAEAAIENLTQGGSVAELSQQIERLIAGTAEELEEALALYGAVALLEEVESQLSEDARLADLLAAASLHFARLTGGMFTRVEFKDAQRKELVVVRAGAGPESTLDPQALSDGTRDQLWLALRLALIEPHLSAKRLPLVLDDILVHFDPARTTASLEALAEIARHTQVILFTHHPHVVALAHSAGLDFEAIDLPAREALGEVPPRAALDPAVPRPRAVRPSPSPQANPPTPRGDHQVLDVDPGDGPDPTDARILVERLATKEERKSGNIALRRELDWTEERYDRVKDELVARGLLEVGQGRGGSVRLASAQTTLPAGLEDGAPRP